MITASRFRHFDRDGVETLAGLRIFLQKEVLLYREKAIFEKSGGRDGDLGKEVMEYEVHVSGTAGGMTTGGLHLYSVIDDSTNGYAHMMSALLELPDREAAKLLPFLESLGFVSNRSSFKDRPQGFKSYRSYLDASPGFPASFPEFSEETVRKASAPAAA